jgi:hypothetical protein
LVSVRPESDHRETHLLTLAYLAHWRFVFFHGQKNARLAKHETVYDKPKHERTKLIKLLSPLFFFAFDGYLRDMERLWVDEVIIEADWKTFMSNLLEEWQDVILWVMQIQVSDFLYSMSRGSFQSAVMLTANVGFLAIPGVVISNLSGSNITTANQVVIFTSSAQIASSFSIEASVASIVIGLLMVRRNRTNKTKDPWSAVSQYSRLTYVPK